MKVKLSKDERTTLEKMQQRAAKDFDLARDGGIDYGSGGNRYIAESTAVTGYALATLLLHLDEGDKPKTKSKPPASTLER